MICTFYSYKGGVGRSMAMANVADLLARGGLRVLMIDFDLEAPGLEQFFQVNYERIRRQTGLLDLLLAYKRSMSTAAGADAAFRDLSHFICPIYEKPLPGGGRLDLLPAGQRQDREQLARYALNLRSFDWQDFYFNWEGELFFEWLRRELTPERYQVVLVDSRTGVTEMGGICGYQLADVIVMMCAANHQNVQGTVNMLADFRSPTVEALRGGRPLQVIVVPARVEQRDPALLNAFFARFDEAFKAHESPALHELGLSFRDLMVPYEPLCAFEEQVVSDPERRQSQGTIGLAFARLAKTLNRLCQLRAQEFETARFVRASQPSDLPAAVAVPAPPEAAPPPAETARASSPPAAAPIPAVLAGPVQAAEAVPAPAQYDAAKRFAGYDVFLDCSQTDVREAEQISGILRRHGLQVFHDQHDISPGRDWRQVIEEALFHSRTLVCCVGAQPLSEWRLQTIDLAVKTRARGRDLRIIPVLLPGTTFAAVHSGPLATFQALAIRDSVTETTLRPLVDALSSTAGSSGRVETASRPPYLGLVTFDEQHADLWFGRERALEQLATRLESDHAVLLCGASGAGKTSLVLAGLVPRLRSRESGKRAFSFVSMPMDAHPRRGLRRAIAQLRAGAPSPLSDDASLRDWLTWAHGAGERSARRVLVFLDNFEDLFGSSVAEAERTAFLRELEKELIPALNADFELVATLRSECLPDLARFPELSAFFRGKRLDLGPLTREELREAIEKPAERVGLAFEPGLVERLLADLGTDVNSLGLLQSVLVQLWNRRRSGWMTNAEYDAIGGVSGALAQRAEKFHDRLTPPEREALRWIMLQLVQVGDHITRRRTPEELLQPVAVAEAGGGGRPVYQTILRALCAEGLATAAEDQGRVTYELAHEALTRWERLRRWVAEDRQFQQWRQALELRQQQWRETRGQLLDGSALDFALVVRRDRANELTEEERRFIDASEDARRRRRRRQGAAALVLGTVTILGLALVVTLYRHAGVAKDQARVAQLVSEFLAAGDVLGAEGRSEAALSNYNAALTLSPRDPELLLRRGRAFLDAGQPAPATNDFLLALAADTDNERKAAARLGLGQAWLALGQVPAALTSLDQATSLAPSNATLWLVRGSAYATQKAGGGAGPAGLEVALNSYNRALQLNPKMADALMGRATVQLELGRTNAAMNDLQQVARLESADPRQREAAAARLRELGATSTPVDTAAPTRVVIYLANASDLARLRDLTNNLPKSIQVQSIRPPSTATRSAGLAIYHFPQDEGRAKEAAVNFESALAKRGVAVRLRPLLRDAKSKGAEEAQPGRIEIWLPPLAAPSLAPFEQRTLKY